MTLDVTNFRAMSAREQTSQPGEIRFNRLLVGGKIVLFRVVNCARARVCVCRIRRIRVFENL